MSTFLIQNWGEQDDWIRYLTLLGITALLAVIGIASGVRFGDQRGARALLGIVLSSVPIHFAITGGLLYSRYALDAVDVVFPGGTRWVALSGMEAWLPAVLAFVVLTPIVFLAARTLFRGHAKVAALCYLGASVLIWIPIRDVFFASAIAFVAFAIGFWGNASSRNLGKIRETLEARWVRVLLYAPAALIWARQFTIYDVHYALVGSFSVAVAAAILFEASRAKDKTIGQLLDVGSLAPIAVAWSSLGLFLEEYSSISVVMSMALVALGFFVTAVAIAMDRKRSWLALLLVGGLGSGALLALASLVHLVDPSTHGILLVTLSTILITTVIGSAGYVVRQYWLSVICGGFALLAAVVHFGITLGSSSPLGWGGLLVVGLFAVVGATMVEKFFRPANRNTPGNEPAAAKA